MNYTILSTRPVEDILNITVKFNFDGQEVTVEMPVQQPDSMDAITTAIENRATSEKRKFDASQQIATIISDIDIGQPIAIDILPE